MLPLAVVVLLGVLGGVAVGLQSPIAGAMSQKVGGVASSFIVHVGGAIISGILLVVRRGEQIGQWRDLSWYMLGAGVFGVVLYLTLSQTFPRLGATAALTLIIVGQLLTGIVIDQFGLFGGGVRPIGASRALGALVLLGGAYLVLR
ncbi:MAG TPA: DMT family transporter [Ktedonobacterales bacterium]|jgi:transporter family-2 protein|nr:DMT family transporter [Ktedonobacterales bacterium]